MSVSCSYECEDRYKKDIDACHHIYELEAVSFTENDILIHCIRNAENKYQSCSKSQESEN